MAILIPFGLRDGTLIHISEVDRGEDCNCVCPECDMALVAKKGFIRKHYFSHHPSTAHPSTCGGGVESALHRYAKQIIAEAGYLAVPAFEISLPPPDFDLKVEIPAKRMTFARVVIEESMVFGHRRVDVVGHIPEGRLLIEICVTHRVRGKKLQEVKVASEAMVEIELPWDSLYSKVSEGNGSLRQSILDSLDNKRWLFHPEGEDIRARLKKQARDRRVLPPPIQPREWLKVETLPRREWLKTEPLPREVSPTPTRGKGHVPSREGLSEEEYVQDLHEFLAGSNYNEEAKQRAVYALRMLGNITARDIEVATSLGLTL